MKKHSGESYSRYLVVCAGLVLLVFVTLICISFSAVRTCQFESEKLCALLEIQSRKLAGMPDDVDTVFIGDSSLGNAIDTATYADLASEPRSYSFALTAFTYGIPSAVNVLQRVLKETRPRRVIIMFSPEAYRRKPKVSAQGYVLSSAANNALYEAFSLKRSFGFSVLDTYIKLIFDHRTLLTGLYQLTGYYEAEDCGNCLDGDYMRQRPPLDPKRVKMVKWKGPYGSYKRILQKMSELCQAHQTTCLYFHGPTLKDILAAQKPGYMNELNAIIAESGLTLVERNPMSFPLADIGDRINHVRPELKKDYTRAIFEKLKPLLRLDAGSDIADGKSGSQ